MQQLGIEKHEIVVAYSEGDSVRINDGPLTSFIGTVDQIDIEKNKVRVIVSMFGRETPVELELDPGRAGQRLTPQERGTWEGLDPRQIYARARVSPFIQEVLIMAQKVTGYIKLQIPAAKATASPPVGPALGQHGVNISQFIKEFNERTKDQAGFKIPVVITVYADRSFTFVTKTPPTPTLILKALGIEKGSGVPNKDKVATITKAQVKEIAERKMPDLTATTIEAAMSQVAGTCRSMGIVVVD